MAFKRYKHLNVPDSWERYWTKYPQGMSILESLFEWVSQVDSMVDNQNKLSANVEQFRNEIDDFVGRFDERLQTEVIQTLEDWQDSGFLDVVISDAIQWQLDDYIATNEQDKISLTTQLQKTMNKTNNIVSTLQYGIVGDGTDETVKFQQAIDESVGKTLVVAMPLTKLKISTINIPSNTHLIIAYGATIEAISGFGEQDKLFNMISKENISIFGRNVTIKMLKSEYTTGEWRHVFNMLGSKNIYIEGVSANDSGGDGFYVGRDSNDNPCVNIKLIDCKADNNRRQGLSITSCDTFLAERCVFSNTSGTEPAAGVDIEPNRAADVLKNIKFNYCVAYGNDEGFLTYLSRIDQTSESVDITFNQCQSYNNQEGFRIERIKDYSKGSIKVIDCLAYKNTRNGYRELNCSGIGLVVEYIRSEGRNNNTGNGSSLEYGYASTFLSYYDDSMVSVGGNSVYIDCKSIDDRVTPLIVRGFAIKGSSVKDVSLLNCSSSVNHTTHEINKGENIIVKNDLEEVYKLPSHSGIDNSRLGQIVTEEGASQQIRYTLPLAQKGIRYMFRVATDFGIKIIPQVGRVIYPLSNTSLPSLSSTTIGSFIEVEGRSDGNWNIINIIGTWTPVG